MNAFIRREIPDFPLTPLQIMIPRVRNCQRPPMDGSPYSFAVVDSRTPLRVRGDGAGGRRAWGPAALRCAARRASATGGRAVRRPGVYHNWMMLGTAVMIRTEDSNPGDPINKTSPECGVCDPWAQTVCCVCRSRLCGHVNAECVLAHEAWCVGS